MPQKKRGPRRHRRSGAQNGDQPNVSMAALLGVVLYVARKDVGLGQIELGERLGIPQSGISKIERGRTTLSVYHLDRYAEALYTDEEAGGSDGWEFYRRACSLADLLAERGYEVWWTSPQAKEGVSFIRGRELAELVERLWERAREAEADDDFGTELDDRL